MKDQDGMALVEFALVLPVLLLVILGVVDFGRALGYKNDMTHLANSAARYAAVNGRPTGFGGQNAIKTGVIATAPTPLQPPGSGPISPGLDIVFSFPQGDDRHCVGDPVKVTVTAKYHWLAFVEDHAGLPALGTGMTSTSTMRLEKAYDINTPANNAYNVPSANTQCP
jgi:Flp pilus assembly protein TadG